jgi:four helix bundle protein
MAVMSFNHEKLVVYQQSLVFNAEVSNWIGQWDNKHAICDHLPRAAGSMLENIAMASAAYSVMKVKSLDYAIGSALECAACIDLAKTKKLLDNTEVLASKEQLSRNLRMLIGLRRTWSSNMVREERASYGSDEDRSQEVDKARDKARDKGPKKVFFHHENLDVYCIALETIGAFLSIGAVQRLSLNVFRRLDAISTSMVLNIAEGNGRFCSADQCRFLSTAHESAIKMAARLDLCTMQGLIPTSDIGACKDLLFRVSAMTAAMIATGQQREMRRGREQ